ncbi:Hypothetical protein Minf_1393 [Methylacidiphilum infernorum V4]|uniref:Uncharacterized protein n=1 Tax=Methylacidiphilum infernorum (isolate V4) TaxID=481448 RepID=B3DVU4_METI4|nr:Hypothetical protein Minf_1393 [Methylacidiphilum infernorum V4]
MDRPLFTCPIQDRALGRAFPSALGWFRSREVGFSIIGSRQWGGFPRLKGSF